MSQITDEDYVAEIDKGHRVIIRPTTPAEYLLRIERPEGHGKALYETIAVSADELRAIWEAIIDTGEAG